MAPATSDNLGFLGDLIDRALKAGADSADAIVADSVALSVSQRLGKPEKLERAESSDVELRVLIGRQAAIVSTSDRREATIAELVDRAISMARSVPEDPYSGLADPEQIASSFPDLDLNDAAEPEAEGMIDYARRAEEAALAVSGVTNSEGAEMSWGRTGISLAASNGFSGAYTRSSRGLSCAVIAGEGTAMEVDYDYTTAVYAEDLDPAEDVGRRAGERAVSRVGGRKVNTNRVPIIFDRRVSSSLLGHLLGAINGAAVARGTSFLIDRLGQPVFAPGITIIDDPFIPRGHRSRPFDGEGLAPRKMSIVDDGVLTSWLLSLRSARQLSLAPTGHAGRGAGSPPSPSPANFHMAAGKTTRSDLIGGVEQGLLVTQMLGSSISMTTGDYSRGASGFWIENGQIAYPVNEVTIAGNLKDMFKAITPADDLELRTGVDAPTLRVDGMTVAGR
ncbi:TldD/PmbA family protein [Fodinicurvata sp. EGI_FJ10296]|uniref:TldD/PmbA family protein n=1 Tax=Fodinicurvata sp. EGI_FJ10296 TaxID=3231908 RepID=UPI003451BA19